MAAERDGGGGIGPKLLAADKSLGSLQGMTEFPLTLSKVHWQDSYQNTGSRSFPDLSISRPYDYIDRFVLRWLKVQLNTTYYQIKVNAMYKMQLFANVNLLTFQYWSSVQHESHKSL